MYIYIYIYIYIASASYHPMVCNRSWHLPGNPKLGWHPAHLRGMCGFVYGYRASKNPLVLFGSKGPALTLTLFILFI